MKNQLKLPHVSNTLELHDPNRRRTPRNDLASVVEELDMLDITINIYKIKSRGKFVDQEVHTTRGLSCYRSEIKDKFIIQTTTTQQLKNCIRLTFQSPSCKSLKKDTSHFLNFLVVNLASPSFFISSDSFSTDLCWLSLCFFNLFFSIKRFF